MEKTHRSINEVRERISGYIHRTPVMTSERINLIAGCSLYFKCENFQKMGAFKMRGAANAISRLSAEESAKGVATHSSGNFAQALALSAKSLGVKAYIVMPEDAPAVKKAAVREYKGQIIECAPTLAARETTLNTVVAETGATFIHPYDDLEVIYGQGTATLELLQQIDNLDIVVVPVGGGGLISGACIARDQQQPKVDIYGAEPFLADDAYHSLQTGIIQLPKPPKTIGDGLRTAIGKHNFPIMLAGIKEIIRIEEQEIIDAMRIVWESMKIIIEPSSATTLAAVLRERSKFEGKRIGLLISGGNVDVSRLPF